MSKIGDICVTSFMNDPLLGGVCIVIFLIMLLIRLLSSSMRAGKLFIQSFISLKSMETNTKYSNIECALLGTLFRNTIFKPGACKAKKINYAIVPLNIMYFIESP